MYYDLFFSFTRAAGFVSAEAPFSGPFEEGDYDRYICDQGFSSVLRLGSEFELFQVNVWLRESDGLWLVEFCSDRILGNVLCTSFPDLLVLLTEYAYPLGSLTQGEPAKHFFEQADEVLFDGETGLAAARRHARRERRWRQAARREIKEANSTTGKL